MGLNLNPESIALTEGPSGDFKPVPNGKYLCSLVEAVDEADRQSQNGSTYSRVRLKFEILDGEYSGRLLFKDCIYEHETSDKAAQIGCEFLARLHAAGSCEGNITPEGLQTAKPVVCSVKVKQSTWNGETKSRSEINYVSPSAGGVPTPSPKKEDTGASPW